MKEMPARGADVFLIDRAVIEAFKRFPERHVSVFALITWLGFTQAYVEYDKQPRAVGTIGLDASPGRSSWSSIRSPRSPRRRFARAPTWARGFLAWERS